MESKKCEFIMRYKEHSLSDHENLVKISTSEEEKEVVPANTEAHDHQGDASSDLQWYT